tara:strand:- start:277 stop:486 length:210 start_codon:yes stop_codon:yes gene_type:complete
MTNVSNEDYVDQITRDSDRVDRFRRRLVKAEAQVKHLTEVTQMHRRIIDMLVKDMLKVMPNRKEQSNDQ